MRCSALQLTFEMFLLVEECMLQCAAVCCSVLQCAAVCYSSLLRCVGNSCLPLVGFDALVARLKGQYQLRFLCIAVCCRVSQRVAVCQFDALVVRHKDQYQLRSTIFSELILGLILGLSSDQCQLR